MYKTNTNNLNKNQIDDDWEKFLNGGDTESGSDSENESDDLCMDEFGANDLLCDNMSFDNNINININNKSQNNSTYVPKCSDIYISTKTKIAYLNKPIDLNLFWNIPLIPYAKQSNGVIKKQMKFKSTKEEDLNIIKEKLKEIPFYEENIIKSINNPSGRIKFKDIRKISIGISKKDLTSYRCKKKSAFDNCFVLLLRLEIDDTFKEFHVKVFNTGKLELPGIQTDVAYNLILESVSNILKPFVGDDLGYKENSTETILINSNFNCGYYINREKLYNLLKYKYKIQAIYDPCSYPGIQSKFHYNPNAEVQNGIQIIAPPVIENKEKEKEKKVGNVGKKKNGSEVSFMIFRTGSVLIVGKCDEAVLYKIYEFLKNILVTEFKEICEKGYCQSAEKKEPADADEKDKKKKTRRKQILINVTTNTNNIAI